MELWGADLERQDLVDNAIFELINLLNPSSKEIEWDIYYISQIRDVISDIIVNQLELSDEYTFYPFVN